MKKTLGYSISAALLALSSIALASPIRDIPQSCPSSADVQQVVSLVKNGAYTSDYHPSGAGPMYRIHANSSPSLPSSIIAWLNNHQGNGNTPMHRPLLMLRIVKQQTDLIHWLSKPKVVTFYSDMGHDPLKLCQYAQSGIFQVGGVFLSPGE